MYQEEPELFLILLLFFFFKLLLWYTVNSTQLIFTISQFFSNEKRVGIHFVMNTICKQRQRWILYTFLQENWTRLPVFPFKQLVSLFVFLIFAKRVIIVNILITYHLFYLSIIHTYMWRMNEPPGSNIVCNFLHLRDSCWWGWRIFENNTYNSLWILKKG